MTAARYADGADSAALSSRIAGRSVGRGRRLVMCWRDYGGSDLYPTTTPGCLTACKKNRPPPAIRRAFPDGESHSA